MGLVQWVNSGGKRGCSAALGYGQANQSSHRGATLLARPKMAGELRSGMSSRLVIVRPFTPIEPFAIGPFDGISFTHVYVFDCCMAITSIQYTMKSIMMTQDDQIL